MDIRIKLNGTFKVKNYWTDEYLGEFSGLHDLNDVKAHSGLNINFKAAKEDNLIQTEVSLGTNAEMILKIKDDDLNIYGISFDGNKVTEW